ncbi:MAG: RNA methyltransferase [Hyphomonadaceae bacterium]|nr:RNA methyltransferase [Hyphomonadaceae bacterium]
MWLHLFPVRLAPASLARHKRWVIISLSSGDDLRLAPYRGVRERDLLRDGQRFIVEGKVTLARLVEASRFPVESVFLAESRVEPMGDVIAKLQPDVPVYVAPQAVMDGITGFHIHRGVLAIARRGAETGVDDLVSRLPAGPLTLLALIELSNHDNVGACFRNGAAFGADAVLLDATSCDPLYRKSIRVSAGTALSLPFARSGDGMEMMAALERAGIEPWALSPTGGEPLNTIAPPERVAIVLGAEGPGLPPALMTRCRRVSIAMSPGIDSLNVATAGAIALSHVFARRMERPDKFR